MATVTTSPGGVGPSASGAGDRNAGGPAMRERYLAQHAPGYPPRMRVSITHPRGAFRIVLSVETSRAPWRVTMKGQDEEAWLSPGPPTPAFLAGGYPSWLSEICASADDDRELAERIVAEVERQH